MPRRNRNASERTEKRWDSRYINNLMKQLKSGKVEREYDVPVPTQNTNNDKKKRK
jgi:hypothetical protein